MVRQVQSFLQYILCHNQGLFKIHKLLNLLQVDGSLLCQNWYHSFQGTKPNFLFTSVIQSPNLLGPILVEWNRSTMQLLTISDALCHQTDVISKMEVMMVIPATRHIVSYHYH